MARKTKQKDPNDTPDKKQVMRAVGGKLVPMKFQKDGWPELPFLMRDHSGFLDGPIVILDRSIKAWRGVAWSIGGMVIVDRVCEDRYCAVMPGKTRFHWNSPTTDLGTEPGTGVDHTWGKLEHMRFRALNSGATPEAIRLIHGYLPFTDTEIDDMTAKLAKKDGPSKAKGTPAPKKEGKPKGKGNPEALAKAREARESGPDTRKLTILKKENPYREGSNRAASFDALKGAKTVQDYVDAGGKKKYIARWEEDGIISVK